MDQDIAEKVARFNQSGSGRYPSNSVYMAKKYVEEVKSKKKETSVFNNNNLHAQQYRN